MKRINFVSCQLVKEKSNTYETNTVNSPSNVYDIAKSFLENVDREHFVIFCLDTKNKITAINTVSIGTLNSSLVHPREVFKIAILANSNNIILVHNHPSGDTTPSQEDIKVTKRMVEAGEVLGINVLDHIIIGDYYTSLKERGII